MQFRTMQISEILINFRDGEDFFELLGIIYTKLVVLSLSKLLQAWKNMAGQVGSGYLDPTRPDPPGSGPDPTQPAVLVNIPDPTRHNPTRPNPRVDPTREQLWVRGGRT